MAIFDEAGSGGPILWCVSPEPVPYPQAVAAMERHAEAIRRDGAPELVWLLEHPPLYTAGTSAKPQDLLLPGRLPVFQTGAAANIPITAPDSVSSI